MYRTVIRHSYNLWSVRLLTAALIPQIENNLICNHIAMYPLYLLALWVRHPPPPPTRCPNIALDAFEHDFWYTRTRVPLADTHTAHTWYTNARLNETTTRCFLQRVSSHSCCPCVTLHWPTLGLTSLYFCQSCDYKMIDNCFNFHFLD